MNCKCKITCVKVWMCLAVCGCLITLILAGIVLSSYNFDSVIGPLSCKLIKYDINNCCYDTNDCNYGKEKKYYFSSNSTHCMNKFNIYEHPTNTTVRFTHTTQCYPSLRSLKQESPTWNINDSVTFYVNKDCTEWTEGSAHTDIVDTNLMWITIILSFVGCSCVSMICGFITMYHMEIYTCLTDYCCLCGCNCCDFDDGNQRSRDHKSRYRNRNDVQNGNNNGSGSEDDAESSEEEDDDGGSTEESTSKGNSSTSGDGNKYNPNGHRRRPSPMKNNLAIPPLNNVNGSHSHLSVDYAVHRMHKKGSIDRKSSNGNGNRNSNDSSILPDRPSARNSNHSGLNVPKNKRPRGASNASQMSKLSPLSGSGDHQQPGWNALNKHSGIKQFVVDEGDEKYRAQMVPEVDINNNSNHNNEHDANHNKHASHKRLNTKELASKKLRNRVYNKLIHQMNPDMSLNGPTSASIDDNSTNGGYEYNRKKFSRNNRSSINGSDTGNMNDDELEDMIEEIASTGMSDSVYFENEWYDESDPRRSAKSSFRKSNHGHSNHNSMSTANDILRRMGNAQKSPQHQHGHGRNKTYDVANIAVRDQNHHVHINGGGGAVRFNKYNSINGHRNNNNIKNRLTLKNRNQKSEASNATSTNASSSTSADDDDYEDEESQDDNDDDDGYYAE